jgi:hypothetical protein
MQDIVSLPIAIVTLLRARSVMETDFAAAKALKRKAVLQAAHDGFRSEDANMPASFESEPCLRSAWRYGHRHKRPLEMYATPIMYEFCFNSVGSCAVHEHQQIDEGFPDRVAIERAVLDAYLHGASTVQIVEAIRRQHADTPAKGTSADHID